MTFQELGLAEPILRALTAEGYTTPTPIQARAIPHVLLGKDLLGCAQTGTGKTAAFALPIIQRLMAGRPAPAAAQHAAPAPSHAAPAQPQHRPGQYRSASQPAPAQPASRSNHVTHVTHAHGHNHGQDVPNRQPARRTRALILAPTRELAAQIGDSFRVYGRFAHLRYTVIFGGVGQNPQVRALREGVDIVVATPGRLMDLMEQGHVDLRHIEVFVLDEADRMLDMGFIHDIRRIAAKLPPLTARQTLLFSATMPNDIRALAASLLNKPVGVEVAPVSATADKIEQAVYYVDKRNKTLLMIHLLEKTSFTRTLVFTRTKHGADKLAKQLDTVGIRAEAIHGNKSQNARERALNNFRSGKTPILIASDIASRGIDIDEISHVINYDLPNVPETYVHRIGRTARAGASGIAISFCDPEERSYLRDIERLTRIQIPIRDDHPPYPARSEFSGAPHSGGHGGRGGQQRGGSGHRSGGGGGHSGGGRPQSRSSGSGQRPPNRGGHHR
ncbi:MAG: DEAD/DEAH box helicase [Planctomycetes bacterium]|nr:DEAD/DEAH box helicase [Planctomycetota bacterium]